MLGAGPFRSEALNPLIYTLHSCLEPQAEKSCSLFDFCDCKFYRLYHVY